MFHHLHPMSSRGSLPSAALSLLCGPRTFTAHSTKCATESLQQRKARVRRLLARIPPGRTASRYRNTRFGGRQITVHRLVMEILLGRTLGPREHVHHIDGDTQNNHPSNLQLLSASQHKSQTFRKYPLLAYCLRCKKPFVARGGPKNRQRWCSRQCVMLDRWARNPGWRTRRPGKGPRPVPEGPAAGAAAASAS